jgi:hypothetical protein
MSEPERLHHISAGPPASTRRAAFGIAPWPAGSWTDTCAGAGGRGDCGERRRAR